MKTLTLFCLLTLPTLAADTTIVGKVVGVHDGDTLDELVGKGFHVKSVMGFYIHVAIGSKAKKTGDHYEVPYRLKIIGEQPLGSNLPTEYANVGKISGSGDECEFRVRESFLKIEIGDTITPGANEFKTRGTFKATGKRMKHEFDPDYLGGGFFKSYDISAYGWFKDR